MPVLGEVIERLGLEPESIGLVARYRAQAVRAALDDVERHRDEPGRTETAREDPLVDYVTTHGLRALGLLALVDQDAARELGDDLLWWLREVGHPAWPLAFAVTDLSDRARRFPDLGEAPPGYPTDLAWLLLDPGLDLLDLRTVDRRRGFGRGGLAPYRLDLRLLSATAKGGNSTQPGTISEPSAPAVVRALMGSVEDALVEARLDQRHWRLGAASIAPTDPEILLAVRILLRSPSSWALRGLQHDSELAMVGAVVDLADAL